MFEAALIPKQYVPLLGLSTVCGHKSYFSLPLKNRTNNKCSPFVSFIPGVKEASVVRSLMKQLAFYGRREGPC